MSLSYTESLKKLLEFSIKNSDKLSQATQKKINDVFRLHYEQQKMTKWITEYNRIILP